MSIIERVNWSELDQLVLRQQRNRAAHAPVISLYRWWARRPHSFAGALLDAAATKFGNRFLVADPFSGGGTVAFEAARRQLPIYAQDLYPWPSSGLATALTRVSPEAFSRAAKQLLLNLASHRKAYWRKSASGDWWEATHVIRVRQSRCTECATNIFLFRDALISIASRRVDEKWAFFGCAACGSVSKRLKGIEHFVCKTCHLRTRVNPEPSTLSDPQLRCPHCRRSISLSLLLAQAPLWHPVVIREHRPDAEGGISCLRPVDASDPHVEQESATNLACRVAIPDGLETSHLKRHGFTFWGDLYTPRQLTVLTAALEQVNSVDAADSVQRHLRLAILGAAEMPGYVCRWERYHPKALEAIANHRFARTTVAVESNLLSPSGRGTLPRRFEAAAKALRWMSTASYPARTRHALSDARRTNVSGALVVTGSSQRQALRDGAAQLVFTDPPYHDDLQYGELARLFHAWMNQACETTVPDEMTEAVPNSSRGTGTRHYEDVVAACLTESNRTLAADGRLLLTFHNKDLRAWEALARALRRARFAVIRLATVLAENAADHSKRGKQTFLSDLVIECKPSGARSPRLSPSHVHGALKTPERRNLAAIGLALAEFVKEPATENLEPLFRKHLKALKTRRVLIRRGGA